MDPHFIILVKAEPSSCLAERTNKHWPCEIGITDFYALKSGLGFSALLSSTRYLIASQRFSPLLPRSLKSVQLGLISRDRNTSSSSSPNYALHHTSSFCRPHQHQSTCPRHLFRSPPLPSRRPPSLSTVSSRRSPSPTSRVNGESDAQYCAPCCHCSSSPSRYDLNPNTRQDQLFSLPASQPAGPSSHMNARSPHSQGRPSVLPHGLHLCLPH